MIGSVRSGEDVLVFWELIYVEVSLVPSTSFLCGIESSMIDILVPLTPSPGGVNRAPLFLLLLPLLHLLLLLFRALWNDAGMTSDRHCVGMCVAVVDDF